MAHQSEYCKVRKRTGQAAGRSRSEKEQTDKRTGGHAADGFLNHSFLPVWEKPSESLNPWKTAESDFFRSLSNLSGLYGFEPVDTRSRVYPHNIAVAYDHAASCLKELRPKLSLIIIQDEFHKACLTTVKTFNTGSTLYFINVRPLYELLKDRRRIKSAELMMSVFAWLYKVVDVPYYRDRNTYMYHCFESIDSWLEEEPGAWDRQEFKKNKATLKLAAKGGDLIQKKISDATHIQKFEKRVSEFKPSTPWEHELLQVSKKAMDLFTCFPNRSITGTFLPGLLDPLREERAYYEQYLSFYWDDGDFLYDNIIEFVNNDLQEMSTMDEPMAIQLFDTKQPAEIHDLDFPARLFDFLHELSDNLYSYEKYYSPAL